MDPRLRGEDSVVDNDVVSRDKVSLDIKYGT